MRILVTNDDGIDSVGLHVLARAMVSHGDVVVVAPDREYSGSSAAIGSLQQIEPELRVAHIEGIDEAWSVSGAPALCVFLARLGVFGERFDVVVAGINPGANVGRRVPLGHRRRSPHRPQQRHVRRRRQSVGDRLRRRGPGLG